MKYARKILLMATTLLCSIAIHAEGITAVSQLSNTKLYFVSQPQHNSGIPSSWIVADGDESMKVNTQLNITSDRTDVRQQFAFISNDGGVTHYLYHPASQKYVNKEGILSAIPWDPVFLSEGVQEGTFVVYFDHSHVINTNDTDGLIINRWGPFSGWGVADAGNSCAVIPVGEFDPAAALAMFAQAEEEKKKIIEFKGNANSWIDGTEWYDETQKIVSYTSPLYRFQDNVDVLRITVNRTKGNTKYFCLSELEFYDAEGNKIGLTENSVVSNADHNALNPAAPDGGGFAALFDGETSTYFHSAWKNMPAEEHYLEITFLNGGYDAFSFRMLSRAHSFENNVENDQSHTFPGDMVITTSAALDSVEVPETPEEDKPVGVVYDLSVVNPAKCYTVTTNGRGAWAVDTAGLVFSSTASEGIEIDSTDTRQQFAIVTINAKDYYLYSVSAKKFVKKDGSLFPFAEDAIELTDASAQGEGRVQVRFRDYTDAYINLGNQGQMTIDSWSIIDAGNAVLIAEADDFDATDALAILADPEGAMKSYLVAQAQELLALNADNHAETPALGQYSTDAYENLEAIVNTDSVTVESLEMFIATFESSKCMPVFTIDGVYDYADGMSIYDAGERFPNWKATDINDESMLWAFDMTDTIVSVTDKVVIKNVATGNVFLKNLYGASYIRITETSENIADDGIFLMFCDEDTRFPVYAMPNGMVSRAEAMFSANSTCAWKFTYAGTTYGIKDELPDTTVSESDKWAGVYSVKANEHEILHDAFTASDSFEMEVTYNQEDEAYYVTRMFGYDLTKVLANGIPFTPSTENPNEAEIRGATTLAVLGYNEEGRIQERFVLRHVNLAGVPLTITRLEDNTFTISDFCVTHYTNDYDTNNYTEVPAAYYRGVTAKVASNSSIVSNLAAADPTKCYSITTNGRGAWAVDINGTRFSTTGIEELDVDATDTHQQFAILSANEQDYYLYSVSAKKFVKHDRTLVAGIADAIEFVDASAQGEGRVLVRFRDLINTNINIGGDNQMVINWWGIIDEGNAVLIAEAGDFDATEALAMLLDPESAEINALKAQIEELVNANADNHATEPALGQYLTSAYEALVATINADSINKQMLETAIAAFESTKCLPVFTIDGVNGHAAGMSIYDSTYDNILHWKETNRKDRSMLWVFNMNDTVVSVTDRVEIKNLATGSFFEDAFFVKIAETEENIADDGLFLIYPEGMGLPVCAFGNGNVQRGNFWSANSIAAWKFTFAGTTYGINELPVGPDTPDAPVFTETVNAFMPLEIQPGENGWIEGAEWYDEEKGIVGYTSPLCHFQNKIETFRIIVKRNKGDEPFFCLSELGFYDADGVKIELTEANVTSNADHNALNPESPDGGGIAALFDDDTKTYFHSAWQNIPDEYHYLEITLPNGGYDTFGFRMLSRCKDGAIYQDRTFPAEMTISETSYHDMLKKMLNTFPVDLNTFPEVGYYHGDFTYLRVAISEAWDLVENNASEAECEEMVAELTQVFQQFWNNETVRMPEPGKVYHVISAFEGFYENQLVDKAIAVKDNTLWWENLDADSQQQGFMFEPVLDRDSLPIVEYVTVNHGNEEFITEERHYLYFMKHAATGLYVDLNDAGGGFHLVEQPCILRINCPYNANGQFQIITERYIGEEDGYYILFYLHAGNHNNGQGVSSAIVNWNDGFGTPSAWVIREMHELPYTMPVTDAVFKSGFIHFEATDVITLTADKECSFTSLALRDEFGNWLRSVHSEETGNTITLTLDRKITSCAFQFANVEGISSVTFNAGVQEEISSDYAMKAQNIKSAASRVVNLPIEMDNATAVTAFQFDLYLPDGISVASIMEDDEIIYDIAFNDERAKSSHILVAEPQSDGALRVVAYSTSNAPFVGDSGVLVNVALSVGDIPEGNYHIIMSNIRMVTEDEEGNAIEKLGAEFQATLTVEDVIPGDVNSDGNFTMIDVVMMVNAVLEKEQINFNDRAADLNGDGTVTMVDVVGVLRLVLTDGMAKAPAYRTISADVTLPELKAFEPTVIGDGDVMLPVALDNSEQYSAFQLDVVLPVGVEFTKATLADRAKETHTVAWNTLSDGTVRIVAYASDNALFEGNAGALLNLILKTSDEQSEDANIVLTDGLFATAYGAEHRADDLCVMMRSKTTGVDDVKTVSSHIYGVNGNVIVECDIETAVSIYDLTGKLLKKEVVKAGKNIIALPTGVYVVNGNKVIVK